MVGVFVMSSHASCLARRARVFTEEFSFEISPLQQYPQTPDVLLYWITTKYDSIIHRQE